MITVSAEKSTDINKPFYRTAYIVAQPNQSASWHTNKQLIIVVSVLTGIIATFFTAIGAWLVLPFAGIEMTALGSALYIVCRNSHMRHVLTFHSDRLILEKGTHRVQQQWQLNKAGTSIFVERQHHHWDPIKIYLCQQQDCGKMERIPLGDFLNKADSLKLLAILRQRGLMVRNDSHSGNILL